MFDTMVGEEAVEEEAVGEEATVGGEAVGVGSVRDWDGEDRLVWELTEAAMAESAVAESGVDDPVGGRWCLPPDLDAWPVRLVVLLSTVDPDRLSPVDRVAYLRAADRANSAGQARFFGGGGGGGRRL